MRALKSAIHLLPCLAIGAAFGAAPAESPYATPQPPFFGQVRTRTEYDIKRMADTASKKAYLNTQLRSRMGFVAVPSPAVEIKVEMQDVRFMGSEPSALNNPASATVGNRQGVDLLQGYFAVEQGMFKTAVGRQKMSLGAGRFLSTLEWSPTSRSFDGWSGNLNLGAGVGNLTALSFLVRDTNTAVTRDAALLSGVHYSHQINPDIVAEAYSFYDKSRLTSAYGGVTAANYDLVYFGERVAGKVGIFTFEEEFIYQAGDAQVGAKEKSNAAFQLATRAGVVMGNHKANIGLDMMSGDDDLTDDDMKTYRANYYFAHNLYGWMDYFVGNPTYGVMDFRFDADLGLLPGANGNPRVTLKPQFHYFMPQAAPSGMDDAYGSEFDLEAHITWFPKSNIVLGAGLFVPGDGAFRLAAAGLPNAKATKENGMFLYIMPVFNF